MDRKHWWIGLCLILGTLLIVDYYVLHILFPAKKAAIMEELSRNVQEKLKEPEPVAHPTTQ